jgi:hypothetical protein
MLRLRPGLAATLFLGSVLALSAQAPPAPPPKADPKPAVTPAKPAPPPPAAKPRAYVPLSAFTLPLPTILGNARGQVQEMRDGKIVVQDPATKKPRKELQDSMNLIAKELVYAITDPKYYTQPGPNRQNVLAPTPAELTLESRFEAAERFVLVPSWGRKLTIDQYDYIVGFGEAMNAAILDILEPKPAKAGDPPPAVPDIMRVNAARMLATAAKSGAPALYPTILKLVGNPDTDPGVLIYALKAAEGFIAAYNPVLVNDAKYAIHVVRDAEMLKLTEALDAVVKRTKPYGVQPKKPTPPPPPAPKAGELKGGELKSGDPKAPPPPAAKAPPPAAKAPPVQPKTEPKAAPPMPPVPVGQLETETVSPEQQMVVRYFRRAALRALAQCRYPQFIDPANGNAFRPLATLAKIAVGDPSITTTPGNDEIAIAVIGLCNLHDYKDVNFDALCDCIAQGVVNFAGKKAGNAQDKSIPWKVTGSLIMTAILDMKKAPNAGRFANKIDSLTTVLVDRVLAPLEKVGNAGQAPNFEAVARWREQNGVQELKLFVEAKEPPVRPGFVSAR